MAKKIAKAAKMLPPSPISDTEKGSRSFWWNSLPMTARVMVCQRAGVDTREASKSWKDIGQEDMGAILRAWAKEAYPVPATVKPTLTAEKQRQVVKKDIDQIEKTKKVWLKQAKRNLRAADRAAGLTRAKVKPKRVAKAVDLLMWVGSKFYPTIADYVKEARKLGCCKRVGHVMDIIEPGKTRIFLAHDEGIVGEGMIFGYFVLGRVEIILKNASDAIPADLKDLVTPVGLVDARKEPERGCGWRTYIGALYYCSETDFETLKAIARAAGVKEADVKGGLVAFKTPRNYNAFVRSPKHFRGALVIANGSDIILASKPDELKRPPSTLGKQIKPDKPWTKADDMQVLKVGNLTIKKGQPLATGLSRLMYVQGRAKASLVYRYHQLTKEED